MSERSKTIIEFCRIERLSKASYYNLRNRGLGPDELRLPGTRSFGSPQRRALDGASGWRS
jgi:hypothetical protein